MNGDDAAYALYALLVIVLVGSGLVASRMPLGQTLKMALAWVGIFAVGFVGFSFRHDVTDLFSSRVLGRAVVEGGTVRIPMADDGHFWVDARINGKPARLMVDSGATITTLSQASAERTDVDLTSPRSTIVMTANGPLEVQRARVSSISVGNIVVEDLSVHVAPGEDLNVIGMNFLSRLSRWSVEGRWLILQPQPIAA